MLLGGILLTLVGMLDAAIESQAWWMLLIFGYLAMLISCVYSFIAIFLEKTKKAKLLPIFTFLVSSGIILKPWL